jgi:hypothetical protein|tara:strand:+ start:630 stop:788 length:159 start_codon:yes stop_codon:yes gene_type:complete
MFQVFMVIKHIRVRERNKKQLQKMVNPIKERNEWVWVLGIVILCAVILLIAR